MLTRMASFSETPAQGSWLRGSADRAVRDERPVASVVELAAASVGMEREACLSVVKAMEASGVRWAWQLQQLQPHHWVGYRASPGLETSVRHELQHPSQRGSADSKAELYQAGAAAERLRRFLLIPGPDGQEPGRLNDPGAPLLTLLTVPPADRQKLMLTLCELLALVNGLMLPVPLQLMRQHSYKTSESWVSLPSVEDWFDMLLMLNFINLAICIIGASLSAVFVSITGFNASIGYYDGILTVMGLVFNVTIFNVILFMNPLVFWHLFNIAGSPYPMLSMVLFCALFNNRFVTLVWKFHIQGMALEGYHLPDHIHGFTRLMAPNLWNELNAEAFKPGARRRAAELRAMMGIDEESAPVAMQTDGTAVRDSKALSA